MESYTGERSFSGQELVSYNQQDLQVGNCWIQPNYWYPWYDREIHHWYPSVSIVPEKSKVEQAFRILGKLLEKKIVKTVTVKDFIELVNEIAGVL